MPDSKNKMDNRDRTRVAGSQDYEVRYLTEQTGVSAEQARELIRAYGNDRQTLLRAAKSMPSAPRVRSSRV